MKIKVQWKKRMVEMFRELQKRWTLTIHTDSVCRHFCCINSCWKLFLFLWVCFAEAFGSFAKDTTNTLTNKPWIKAHHNQMHSHFVHSTFVRPLCCVVLYCNYTCANKLHFETMKMPAHIFCLVWPQQRQQRPPNWQSENARKKCAISIW